MKNRGQGLARTKAGLSWRTNPDRNMSPSELCSNCNLVLVGQHSQPVEPNISTRLSSVMTDHPTAVIPEPCDRRPHRTDKP